MCTIRTAFRGGCITIHASLIVLSIEHGIRDFDSSKMGVRCKFWGAKIRKNFARENTMPSKLRHEKEE